ncbi:MAG: ArsR/SmtB family transcription factor [Acidimicrobiia bacterium]
MNIDLDCPADELRVLADPLRWRIVELLAAEELCVCHLVEMLPASQSLISHHLRVLRDAGVVESERFRYWTYYRLRPDALLGLAGRLTELARGAPPSNGRRRPCC